MGNFMSDHGAFDPNDSDDHHYGYGYYNHYDDYDNGYGYYDHYDDYDYDAFVAMSPLALGFGFDEETYLYEFCPLDKYPTLRISDEIKVSYHSLINLAEMTTRLIGAWKKRIEIGSDNGENVFSPRGVHYYKLNKTQRGELKSYSIRKLKQVLGGQEQVLEFEQEVHRVATFLKNCVLAILAPCLPHTLPYPVWSIMFSYLLEEDGLEKLGQVCVDETDKETEAELMCKLYTKLAEVYDRLKSLMFNIEYSSIDTLFSLDGSWETRRKSLLERSKTLAELVNGVAPAPNRMADMEN